MGVSMVTKWHGAFVERHSSGIFYSVHYHSPTLYFAGKRALRGGKADGGAFSRQVKRWGVIMHGVENPTGVSFNKRSVPFRYHRNTHQAAFEFPNSPKHLQVRVD